MFARQITCSGAYMEDEQQDIIKNSLPPVISESLEDDIHNEEKEEISSTYNIATYKEKKIGYLTVIAPTNKTHNIGNDYILVLDFSGSMKNVLKMFKRCVRKMITNFSSNDRATIVTFSNNAIQLNSLQPMTTIIKEQLVHMFNSAFMDGSTNYDSAFSMLYKIIQDGFIPNRCMKAIFISDGQPNPNQEGIEYIQQIYNLALPIDIYSISFGNDVKADVLQTVLRPHNMHNYHHVEDVEQFNHVITAIGLEHTAMYGSNLIITIKNAIPLTSFAQKISETEYKLEIPVVKYNDTVMFPLDDCKDNMSIYCSITNVNNDIEVIQPVFVDLPIEFTIMNYCYKQRLYEISNVKNLPVEQSKTDAYNMIKHIIEQEKEHYGVFYDNLMQLIQTNIQTEMQAMQYSNNFRFYNQSSAGFNRMISGTSQEEYQVYRSATR